MAENNFARYQVGVLDVIHKCWRPVISAGMLKSSVQGWQAWVHDRCPCNRENEITGWHVT